MYRGDFAPSSVIRRKFTTADPTGAPVTLAGSPAAKAYKDGSTSTEVTTGVTLTVDFDGVTGLHEIAVDTSSDGSFYAGGSDFFVILTTGTVNGVSRAGEVLLDFSLNARSALRPATAGRALVVDAAGLADTNMVKSGPSGSGTAQTARDLGGTLGAAGAGLSAIPTVARVTLVDTATAVTGLTASDVGAIKLKTDNLPSDPADASDIAALFAALPTAAQNAAALMDLSNGVETGLTPRQAFRLMAAALAGKISGAATTTITIRNAVADSKDRIVATCDSDGNRSAITVDLT